ncbi:hypothetical protein AQUCO_02500213v1 [Aquilegia coerulea]|uniref:RNA polymerase I-specific transcription initiation factor RRN3 n=1 Tax=Aquilegia coerulea TaxID=218851 RepID=A0A2G5DA23_AQUCA|nr:hypothetical protein AQUCO_02500213v1 [Aquilegia coerulea]
MGMEVENTNKKMQDLNEDDEKEKEYSDKELAQTLREVLKSVSLLGSEFENCTEHYSMLVQVFSKHTHINPEDEAALLVVSSRALSRAVSCIDVDHHDSLLFSIFGMSMWNYGVHVMDALIDLIKSLAASSGNYLILIRCLNMLVRNFKPPRSFLPLFSQPRGIAKKEQVLDRVHTALKDIAELRPLSLLWLNGIVVDSMPRMSFKNDTLNKIKVDLHLSEIYVENMLKLERGVLGRYVGKEILLAVVSRLVDLDVEIEWDEILQDDPSKGIFDMEIEDIDEAADYDDHGEEFPKAGFGLQKLGADVFAERLDSLMVLTCEHIKARADEGHLIEVFETLLQSFEDPILKTHKSKFAQFVIFYACSLDPEKCGVRFAVMLADTFVCGGVSPTTRMSVVAYLASYLSRARFLPSSLVASMLKRLVDWCYEYICKVQDIEERNIDPHVHRVFYSGCQAVMYVLCYWMRMMVDVPHLKSLLLDMPLEPIFRNFLDPLKVCLPSIVTEFLRQAKAARLFTVSENFFFNDLLESDLSKIYGGIERLDTFFPFDPCLLKNCDRIIGPHFLYWSMVKKTYDGDDGSCDEDVNEGERFIDGNSESFYDGEKNLDELDLELELEVFENSMHSNMSITPRRPLKHMMPARIRPSTSPEL